MNSIVDTSVLEKNIIDDIVKQRDAEIKKRESRVAIVFADLSRNPITRFLISNNIETEDNFVKTRPVKMIHYGIMFTDVKYYVEYMPELMGDEFSIIDTASLWITRCWGESNFMVQLSKQEIKAYLTALEDKSGEIIQ